MRTGHDIRGAGGRRALAWSACLVLFLALPITAPAAHGPEQRTLVAVFPEQFPPVFQVTGNNVPTGFGIEVMEELAARAGLHIVYRPTRTWEAARDALRAGDADLIPNLGVTTARRKDFDFSRPLTRTPVSAYVRADTHDVRNLDDLVARDRTIASTRINVANEVLRDRAGIKLRNFDTIGEALLALDRGEVDAVVFPEQTIEQMAPQLNLLHRLRRLEPPLVTIERAVAVRKGNRALLDILNREIETFVGTPRYRAIYERWYGAPPPLWTTERVAALIAAVLALAVGFGIYGRFRLLKRANAFNSAVLNTAVEGILTLDAHGTVRSANRAAERMFRRESGGLGGAALRTLFTGIEAEQLHRRLRELLRQPAVGPNVALESTGVRSGGETFPIRLGIARAEIAAEQLFVCTVHDLTDQRRAEHEAEYLTDHDPVTGLLNQRGILLVLANLLELARRNRRPLACLNVGIERFVQINEMYGRQVGDAILVQVGEFLRRTVRGADLVGRDEETLVARLGGNRFLVVLPETAAAGARAVAEKLVTGLGHLTHEMRSEVLRLTGKTGIACYPEHGASAEELVSRAEITLRQAQEHPLDAILVFSSELREQETRTHYWLQRLHTAIEEGRLVLHFQPVLRIADRTVRHYEALVRLEEPDGTLVLPGEFIPAAEKSGLITGIDYRVLELAFSHLAGIEATGRDISLAVNISGAHLGDDTLFRWLQRVFAEGGVTPGRVLFEITETAAVRNLLRAKAFMEPLHAIGCRFVLDDFGVGFTSFAHLRALPVEIVKIDGSFVRDLPVNPQNRALVRAMTDVAHSLGKQVVAEYVESAEILAVLRELGVDYAQGFYIGRPGPELTFTRPD